MKPPGPTRVLLPTLLLALPILAVALLRSDLEVYDQRDEDLFHLPTVLGFARALPRPDLSDYASATGPLYHLMLAPLAAMSGENLLLLRLATAAMSLVMLVLAARLLAGRATAPAPLLALALLPLALSPYVLGPAVRLSTDNAALMWVVATLVVLDRAPGPPPWRTLLLAGALAAAATLTRQIHGWLVGLLVLAALPHPTGFQPARLLPALLPVLALAPLVLLWGGLTPPSFSEHQGGLDPHVGLTELAVLGGLALPWAPWLWAERSAALALGSLALGAVLLLLFPIPWVEDPLRYGGSLWRAASLLPDLLGSTALFWVLVPTGLLALATLLRRAWWTGDLLPAAATLLFLVANLASARAYQKYYEPFLLLALGWTLSRGPQPPRWAWAGPAALALAWLAVALVRFVR